MELLGEGALAFLAAVGITTLVWLAAGLFSRRRRVPREAVLLLPLHRGGPDIQGALRELEALRGGPGSALPVLLVDCGVSPQERRQAALLAREGSGVTLSTPEELEKRLQ